jgi:hypothetical protein
LVVLHCALVIFNRAFILQNNLFLIVEGLLWNRVAAPGISVTDEIHLRLRENILVPFQISLRLQQGGAVRAGVYFHQGVALVDELAFRIVHCGNYSVHLTSDARSMEGSNSPNGVEVNANITLLGRDRVNSGHSACATARELRRSVIVMAQDKKETKGEDEKDSNPYDDPNGLMVLIRMRRCRDRELVIRADSRVLI